MKNRNRKQVFIQVMCFDLKTFFPAEILNRTEGLF